MLGATPQMSPSSTKGKAVSHDCLNPANESRLHKAVYLAPPTPIFPLLGSTSGREAVLPKSQHAHLQSPAADTAC